MVNQRVRSTLVALALFLGLSSSVSASVVAEQGSIPAEAQQVQAIVLHEDFEDDAIGPLGAPWSVTQAGSSQARIESTVDHGKVLLLHGGKVAGDYLLASRDSASSSTEIVMQVAIKPASGAAFIWGLHGAGSSIGARRIRLQREAGSTMLVAQTSPSGSHNCGDLPSGVWSTVTLKVHASACSHTFDVLINGKATACTGLSTGLSQPFTYIDVMDASNEGWGGDVRFDNIDITTPAVQSAAVEDIASEVRAIPLSEDLPVEDLPVKIFVPQIMR